MGQKISGKKETRNVTRYGGEDSHQQVTSRACPPPPYRPPPHTHTLERSFSGARTNLATMELDYTYAVR